MFYLLNPRVWVCFVIAAALALSHFWVYRHGKQVVLADWNAAKAAATADARKLEQERQRHVDEALKSAATREARARTAAAGAGRVVDGLRDQLSAVRLHSEKSLSAALDANRVLSDVFGDCSRAYQELAVEADRATNEALTLRAAWPK